LGAFVQDGDGKGRGVNRIYGVEPNSALHERLREKVREAGLEEVYDVVGVGPQELGKVVGIERESVDTIVTLQSLCSVERREVLIEELYGYLKPGGTWIMSEHVRTHETGWIRWYQGM